MAASLVSLVSCAYVEATSTQYVGVPRFPPVEPGAVQVLPSEPGSTGGKRGTPTYWVLVAST